MSVKTLAFLALAASTMLGAGLSLVRADDTMPAPKPGETPAKPGEPAKPAEGEKKAERPAAPAFTLKDLDGKERTLAEFAGKWVVLEWTNYSCPFVKKFYDSGFMQDLQKTYTGKGVVWLSINSSAEGKQGFQSVEEWKKAAADKKVASTAILLDTDGKVGHLYGAKTTPDIRVIDPKGGLVYEGAIDDQNDMKADPKKANNYVVQVLDAVLAGKDAPVKATKPYGCGVKYAQ